MKAFTLALFGLLGSVPLLHATANGPTITSDGHGGDTFDYSVAPNFGSQFDTGDFFVIYDVPGISLTALSAPTGWTPSEQLVGPNPAYGYPGADDPTIENVVFTYTGTTPITSTTPVDGFDIDASSANEAFNWFGVQYSSSFGPADGNSISLIDAPAAPTVPEPVSVGLTGLGIAGILITRRVRAAARTARPTA